MSDDLQAIRERLGATTNSPWHKLYPHNPEAQKFISNARADVATLLAEVDHLRTLVDARAFPVEDTP